VGINTLSTIEGNVVLKLSKAAFALAAVAFSLFATNAKANAWKMGPLSSQVPVIQQAQDLQETDRREFICLSLAVYHEARGEPQSSHLAVAHVVKNRTISGKYPTSICGVVWDRNQFAWTSRPVGSIVPRERASWEESQLAAYQVLYGDHRADPTGGATSFYDRSLSRRPTWARRAVATKIMGGLVFCQMPGMNRMPSLPSPMQAITTVVVQAAEEVSRSIIAKPQVEIASAAVNIPTLNTQRRWPF
jgi:N-acetylmuramoyl-L-alanine amidase